MGGFKEMLVPTPYFDPTVTFTRQVKTNVQEEHICDITYAGVYRKVKNDIIANVTVTWLDKEEELWELRLFQDANGTPELENYQKKATFTEVVKAVPSTRAKSGGAGINVMEKAAMSLSVDSSGAALACMRAALEQVDLGARGGLATLGARLKVPEPIDGLYKAQQFKIKDIDRAQAGVQNPQKVTLDDVEYLEAYRLYRAQPKVLAQQAGRRAEDEDRHSQYAKRPRAAVEVEAAGRSRGGGGAYAREPCDCDVVEVGADEAAAEERARKRRREMEDRHAREREAERRRAEAERLAEEERNLKMDEAWCEDMDGWYKGDW
jgi:hypothetical protein